MDFKNFTSRLFLYLKPHIGKFVFVSIVMILATALESVIPELTGRIIDDVFTDERNTQTALLYAGGLLGVITLSVLFALSSTVASSWISNQVIMDLRADMFAKLLKLPKKYFDKYPTGRILSKLTYDVEQITQVASTIWLDFLKSVIFAVILIGYLFYKSWELSLSLVVLLPLIFLIVTLSSRRIRNASKKVQKSMGNMTHLLDENILGISLIKIYNAQKQESHKFFNLLQTIRHQRFKADIANSINIALVNILIGICLASVVYFSATYLKMSAGDFIAYFTAISMLVKPVKNLIKINKSLQQAMVAGESVFGFIDEKEEKNTGKKQLKDIKGAIKFKKVCFAYDDNTNVLNNIDLDIKAGETVALVGSTGSGKTTIIQLLAKFYLPNTGAITIDGIDISDFELQSLRTQIAFVDQDLRLFNDSVRGNIALGQIDNMSDEKVENAAQIAHAYEFVQKLNEGFDAQIGENGTRFSGGQRQRLAIARAIAKDSPILILDEATSALDSATEKKVKSAIDKMRKNRTTIIIAHRLSTVQKADKIVVLSQGKIIEQGSHKELLDANGEYALLYKHQFN